MADPKRASLTSDERLGRLQDELRRNALLSDEQLAALLEVSIHTIRADRRRAGIPEVRKRASLNTQARSLDEHEIVGEILDIELGRTGLSLLETTPDMGLKSNGVVRGHILFAQANTLANAVIDADVALTGEAHVRYLYPLYAGERVTAKAKVITTGRRRHRVEVVLRTRERLVFEGTFFIYRVSRKLADYLKERDNPTRSQA